MVGKPSTLTLGALLAVVLLAFVAPAAATGNGATADGSTGSAACDTTTGNASGQDAGVSVETFVAPDWAYSKLTNASDFAAARSEGALTPATAGIGSPTVARSDVAVHYIDFNETGTDATGQYTLALAVAGVEHTVPAGRLRVVRPRVRLNTSTPGLVRPSMGNTAVRGETTLAPGTQLLFRLQPLTIRGRPVTVTATVNTSRTFTANLGRASGRTLYAVDVYTAGLNPIVPVPVRPRDRTRPTPVRGLDDLPRVPRTGG